MKIETRRTVTKHIRVTVPINTLTELIEEHLRHLADDDPTIPSAIDPCADENIVMEDGCRYDFGDLLEITFEWDEVERVIEHNGPGDAEDPRPGFTGVTAESLESR